MADDKLSEIYKKIDREKALINAANLMRQQTNNEGVRSKIDTQIRDGRRNIDFFEQRLRELQNRMADTSLDPGGQSGRPRSADMRGHPDEGAPTPPPKGGTQSRPQYDERGSYGGTQSKPQYSQIGGHGDMMPTQAPFNAPPPHTGMPKSRPNYTRLGASTHPLL